MQSKLNDGSIIISGFVARDAELKTTQNGKTLCKWSVKVGEKLNGDEKEPIWVNCQAWHDVARAASNIKKGDVIFAVGKLDINEHDGKTYKNFVCEFFSAMKSIPAVQNAAPYTADLDLSDFEEILSDGDVPF